jgi:hypothetical protein
MIIKEGFWANSTLKSVTATDGHPIMIYNKHTIRTEITNSLSEYRVLSVKFITTNIKRYNAILG